MTAFLTAPVAVSAQNPAARAERIDALLQRYHQVGRFNGTVLVAESDQVTLRGAYGFADSEEGIRNVPDTRFPIGFISETFVAALVLMLVEEGSLALDQAVLEQVPDLVEAGAPALAGLTLRDLLSEVPPGGEVGASACGRLVAMVEKVTEQAVEDVLHERVLGPLELDRTAYGTGVDAGETAAGVASGHVRTLRGYELASSVDSTAPDRGVEMISTIDDLFQWDAALNSGQLFREASTGERGCGWVVREAELDPGGETTSVVETAGVSREFSARLRRYPAAGHTIVILDNGSNDTRPILRGVSRILFGLPAESPEPSIAERILPVVEAQGVEAGLKRYEERRRNAPDAYVYGPSELNRLGRHFMTSGDVERALEVFEANVGLYPDSSVAHDGLGAALLAAGDTARAVEAFEASLELDPELDQARDRLIALGVPIEPSTQRRVVLPESVLDGFVGTYELLPGEWLSVRREGSRLFARPADQAEVEIVATSIGRFVVRGMPLRFDFHFGSDGKATAVTVVEAGRSVTARRIR